jgi:HEPN domain-containing protein
MTTDEHIKHWLDSAEYDLQVAESLYQSGYYNWCLFIGHLVLEKALKAIYIQSTNDKTPPKIHNLIKLSSLSKLILSSEQLELFDDVNEFNIEARYSDFKDELYKIATKQFTLDYLNKIKEHYKWLKSRI